MLKVLRVHKVNKVLKVLQEIKDLKVLKVLKVLNHHQVILAQQVVKEVLAHKEDTYKHLTKRTKMIE